jgi:hypothetical protein
MIIKIHAANDYLLDILYKNPNTDLGLYLKPLRNGVIVGNCVNAHQYEVIFQDTKYSFLQEETQLDFQSYASPNALMLILSEMFAHLLIEREKYAEKEISWLEKKYQDIDNQLVTIEVPNIYLDSNWYDERGFLLSKYLPQVQLQHQLGNNYAMKIEAKNVYEGINLATLTACFIEITNTFRTKWLDESWYTKYARILTNVENVPYFVFYLFIKRCMRSPKVFETLRPDLENYFKNDVVKFVFTDTHQTRKEQIFNTLGMSFPILDLGCGELQYFKMFQNKGFKLPYYAIDREVEMVLPIVEKMQANGGENLHFYTSLDECKPNEKVNIIVSEVIEHNGIEETKLLLEQLKSYHFNQLIITTPNRDFNQHYAMDTEFRRNDHIYEMNHEEFKSLIINAFDEKYTVEITQIGDSFNGVSPTQMAVISNNDEL